MVVQNDEKIENDSENNAGLFDEPNMAISG